MRGHYVNRDLFWNESAGIGNHFPAGKEICDETGNEEREGNICNRNPFRGNEGMTPLGDMIFFVLDMMLQLKWGYFD